jgi:tRNA pseudouridine55 synthase
MNSVRNPRLPDGLLLLDKPSGCTSFDVVRRLQGLTRPAKVGHTGTLDPLATGLLPLVIGEATKLVPWLAGGDKRYLARVRLGEATDSLDADGQVIERLPVPALGPAEVERALEAFRGPIEQRPPMVSALRHRGRRLHALAREGVEVERQARPVTIHSLELIGLEGADVRLDVRCSAGTYVRSLADDLARRLGTCGHLVELRRIESSAFRIEEAMTPEAFEALEPAGRAARILPIPTSLRGHQEVGVAAGQARRLGQGQRLSPAELGGLGLSEENHSRIVWFHSPEERLVILAEVLPAGQEPAMRVLRVLHLPEKH